MAVPVAQQLQSPLSHIQDRLQLFFRRDGEMGGRMICIFQTIDLFHPGFFTPALPGEETAGLLRETGSGM